MNKYIYICFRVTPKVYFIYYYFFTSFWTKARGKFVSKRKVRKKRKKARKKGQMRDVCDELGEKSKKSSDIGHEAGLIFPEKKQNLVI